ncbi:MAG TPA: RNA methyltransferase [Flavobacteriales bacterium]|jgi:TrmH family RNA methyltransferase|nr:RNA methyltransferase [Flavobacteriales bacterium]
MSGQSHVKRVRALHQKKFRASEGLFLVQGRKPVRELLASALRVDTIYATAEAAVDMHLNDVVVLPAHDLERMGTFEHGNEVVAVAHTPPSRPMLVPKADELVLAFDGISDPGNLGTLLRIADWFGVKNVWCSNDCVEAYNPKCVQASMGSLFRLTLSYNDLPAGLLGAVGAEVSVFKAEASGRDVFSTPLPRPAVLVLGSESHGLSDEVRNVPGTSVAVPRYGAAESLNVAAAAAALCMEFARRGH